MNNFETPPPVHLQSKQADVKLQEPEVAKDEVRDQLAGRDVEQIRNHSPEFQKLLETVDFPALHEEFTCYIEKLGLQPEEFMMRFKGEKEVTENTNPNFAVGGMYSLKHQTLSVYPKSIALLEKMSHGRDVSEDILLSILSHEETHALTHGKCNFNERETWLGNSVVEKKDTTGYSSYAETVPDTTMINRLLSETGIKKSFELFNEGVTDMIGEEVFYAYKKSKGFPVQPKERKSMLDTYISNAKAILEEKDETDTRSQEYTKLYSLPRLLITSVIESVSNNTGLSKKEVWDGIARGYFAQEDLGGDFVSRLFEEVIPESFFKRLEKWNTGSGIIGIAPLLIQVKRAQWSSDTKTRVRRWFRSTMKPVEKTTPTETETLPSQEGVIESEEQLLKGGEKINESKNIETQESNPESIEDVFVKSQEKLAGESVENMQSMDAMSESVLKQNKSLQKHSETLPDNEKTAFQERVQALKEKISQSADSFKEATAMYAKLVVLGDVSVMPEDMRQAMLDLVIEKEETFEEIKERAKRELEKDGITREQRGTYKKINSVIQNRITPAGYEILPKIKDAITGRNEKLFPGREDAWRLYLGIPQENDTFGISNYIPRDFGEQEYCYRIKNFLVDIERDDSLGNAIKYLLEKFDDESLAGMDFKEVTDGVESGVLYDYRSYVMGNYRLSRGQDEKGSYVSYRDKWDLAIPLEKNGFFGKPFEIYDRVYYNPKTFEPVLDDI